MTHYNMCDDFQRLGMLRWFFLFISVVFFFGFGTFLYNSFPKSMPKTKNTLKNELFNDVNGYNTFRWFFFPSHLFCCGNSVRVDRSIFIGRQQYAKIFSLTNRFYWVGKLMAFMNWINLHLISFVVALVDLTGKKVDSFQFFFRE